MRNEEAIRAALSYLRRERQELPSPSGDTSLNNLANGLRRHAIDSKIQALKWVLMEETIPEQMNRETF